MTSRFLILLATAGSAALLGGAFIFQAMGYPPCTMCLWQRWPHAVAILIGFAALTFGNRALAWLGALAALTTSAIGFYHAGVEQKWWLGPSTCTGSGAITGDLLSTDTPRLVMCDVISWQMFGLSMAAWNALFSLILVGVWIMAARRT